MPPVMWRHHLINPCSELDQAGRWRPKARVFWSEGPRVLEQGLNAFDAATFGTKTAADDHAIRQVAKSWIDRRFFGVAVASTLKDPLPQRRPVTGTRAAGAVMPGPRRRRTPRT